MLGYRSVWLNTAGNGLKNEGHQWPLKRVLFLLGVCLFEGRSALQRVVSEVVFFERAEKRGFGWNKRGAGRGEARLSHRVRGGFGVFMSGS